MFSNFWKRLFGATEKSPTVTTATSAAATPDATATASLESVPSPLRAAAAPSTLPDVEISLHRSLNWRAKVLLDGASKEAQASDAPALVDELRRATESVIRQPPDAAAHALLVARNPNSPLPQIVSLFENDPMLVQSLLRQANSVYYRRDGAPCSSVHNGVQRVGMKGVQGILMESMVQNMLCRPGGHYDALVLKVWSHMQRTAPLSRALAPAFGIDPDQAYSLALLHDVGKLVVFDHLSVIRHKRRRELKIPDMFFRQLLWHMHEPLGGIAALRWGMGPDAAHAIGEHHRRPLPDLPNRMTELLYVSERIELAHANFTKLDWEQIWQEGAITSDVVHVQDRLRRMEA